MALRVRSLTDEEREALRRRALSRTAPARAVERARMGLAVHSGESAPAGANRLGVGAAGVRQWLKRFNEEGLAGLEDRPRSGRPVPSTAEPVGPILATAVTAPQTLGVPVGCWPRERLTAYRHARSPEAGGPLPISRSHRDRLLTGEGLRWRQEEPGLGERVDPAFAEQRGASSRGARPRRPAAGWATATRWGRPAPRVIPA